MQNTQKPRRKQKGKGGQKNIIKEGEETKQQHDCRKTKKKEKREKNKAEKRVKEGIKERRKRGRQNRKWEKKMLISEKQNNRCHQVCCRADYRHGYMPVSMGVQEALIVLPCGVQVGLATVGGVTTPCSLGQQGRTRWRIRGMRRDEGMEW